MKVLIILCIFSVCLLGSVQGSTYQSLDPCPSPYKSGDKWYPGHCHQCTCNGDVYSCVSCGAMNMEYDKEECYEYTDDSKVYPACCQKNIKCRGDDGFDESKLVNK